MTPRQRVLAALRRTTLPDRWPFDIRWGAFTPGLMKVHRERTGSALEPEMPWESVEAFVAAAKSACYSPLKTSDQSSIP